MKKKVPVSISISQQQNSKIVFTSIGIQEQKRNRPVDNSEEIKPKFRITENTKVRKLD